ncbi:PH domain-containing protein [Halostella salina]|uniref:PH domain-containing protein n=1 Tax=Halostella salina TaxID=1547897 RepID=UPI000EF7D875|nr:PH domain-containing protein [Halostella salina]
MKLHPISLPYRGVSRGFTGGSALFFLGVVAAGPFGLEGLALTVPLAVVGFLAGVAYEVAYYRRFEYELTEDTFDIDSGVVARREREIPLHRIQNVDISQNVVQRALDVAVLTLETAGGGQTEASLQYVGYDEAKRLQSELRRAKNGEGRSERSGDAAESESDGWTGDGTTAAPRDRTDEPTEQLFAIRTQELLLLSVASVSPGALVLSVVFFPYVDLVDLSTIFALFTPSTPQPPILLVVSRLVALVIGAWVISAALTFARYYDFELTRVGDELQYERGLLQRYSGSIPTEKVQTVTMTDNPVTRRAGYATLVVETAGYAAGQAAGSESAVPLARRDHVRDLAKSVEAFDEPEFERPPERARRRYLGRYSLAVGALTAVLYGANVAFGAPTQWYAALALLVVVPVAAQLTWTHRGYDVQDDHVLTRAGFWTRTTKVVPYYRLQTVVRTRTVFQRRWGLASLTADTAGSFSIRKRDATAIDIDDEDAVRLRDTLRERLQGSLRERRERLRSGRASGDADLASVDDAESSVDGDGSVGSPTESADDDDTDGGTDGDASGDPDGTAAGSDDGSDGPDDTAAN